MASSFLNGPGVCCGKALEKFAPIITRLRQMVEECTALDCVDAGLIPGGLLDTLPASSRLGSTRVGGIDVSRAPQPGRPRRPRAGHRPPAASARIVLCGYQLQTR